MEQAKEEEKMEVEKVEDVEPKEEDAEKAAAASTSSESGSGGKRKRKSPKVEKVEQTLRTPLKRQRQQVIRFQSPAEQEKTVTKPVPSKDEMEILYTKGSYLALRGEDESFFLCRLNQNVCKGKSHKFKLNWLSLADPPNIYKLDYIDKADVESILTNVQMKRRGRDAFELPSQEQERISTVLRKALNYASGEILDEDLEEEEQNDIAEEEDEDSSDEEPAPKRRRTSGVKSSRSSSSKKTATAKTKSKTSAQKDKVKEKRGKGPDRNLKPNAKIKVLEKDPFFESIDKGPFISIPIQSKQVFAAVSLGDMERLKQLMQSDDVYTLDMPRSVGVEDTPLEFALKHNNVEVMEALVTDVLDRKKKKPRSMKPPPASLLHVIETGSYNPIYLGIDSTRALNMCRGCKEGNNAFTKDDKRGDTSCSYYLKKAMQMGVKPATFDRLVDALSKATSSEVRCNTDYVMEMCVYNIHHAIENGHREIAAKVVKELTRVGGFGFNFLHREVLEYENENLSDAIRPASVRKKQYIKNWVTPLHCAAINPNVKYLTRLLQVEPDINMPDHSNKRPIHYAAACTGTKPLEFLLSKGCSVTDVDRQGNRPLHRACASGRAHNVTILLKHAGEKILDPVATSKWGIAGIDCANRSSYCPIHLAVVHGHMEVLKVLLKNKVNVNKQLSANRNKMTPLMLAAERGSLDMVRQLVQSGASVELLDKLKRSALTHAVINGNTNVASYLLYLGADPDRQDSSGNSLVHYAAAYGWYHCLKLLVKDAGAKYNVDNDWKTSPLAIAFLKGHTGIMDFLLRQPGTDVNFKDEKGMTLVSIAACSHLQEDLVDQISYLVKDQKADPTIPDLEGYTALHHLCANTVELDRYYSIRTVNEEAVNTSLKIANILLDAGCDISQPTNVGKTPISLALEQQVNMELVALLIEHGAEIPNEKTDDEKNILHTLAEQCCTTPLTRLIYILGGQSEPSAAGDKKNTAEEAAEKMEVDEIPDGSGDANRPPSSNDSRKGLRAALKKMAAETDFLGFTPLLRACQVYRNYEVPRFPRANQVENAQKAGREFIQALIDVALSDINATVQKKNLPDKETTEYVSEGLFTATHLMTSCRSEIPTKEGDKELKHPGLALILKYNPNLELKSINGESPLMKCAQSNNIDMARMLLQKGANPNVIYKKTTICLWLSAWNHQLDFLRLLLNSGADHTLVDSEKKYTLLHYLAKNRSAEAEVIELMKMVLAKGVSVNVKNIEEKTALHLAVASNTGGSNDSFALEEFLLDQKADVFSKTKYGFMPIHEVFAQSHAQDPIELLSLLTTAMGNQHIDEPTTRGYTPLHLAAQRGSTICCIHLLQRGAQLNRKTYAYEETPLTLAIENKREGCAIMLIQHGANVNDEIVTHIPPSPREEEESPKVEKNSTEKKKKPVLKWRPLQQKQQKKEVERKREAHTIFQGAVYSDMQGVAYLLLNKEGSGGFSMLQAALNVNKFNMALRLLKNVIDNSLLRKTNEQKQTLLHILAIKTTAGGQEDLQMQVAKLLIAKGVPVDTVDVQKCTPLQYCAIYHQPVSLARLLIENSKPFDKEAKDIMGRDLVSAVMWDNDWVTNVPSKAMAWVDLFVEKDLKLDTLFDFPLPDILLFGAKLDAPCPDYFTTKGPESISPLILAIRHYNVGLARYLLKNGADPNFKDSMGYPPLFHAVKMNDLTMVKLLCNFDYIHDVEEKASEIMGAPVKPVLVKKFSRDIFRIKPDKRAEEMEKDPSIEEDGGEVESEADIEKGMEEEDREEGDDGDEEKDNAEDIVDNDGVVNGEVGDENDEDIENEDDDDDSDHDTDVMDDEGDEVPEPPVEEPPQRLGTKQMSLVKVPSVSNANSEKSFKVTSTLNLRAKDPKGMNVFHHAVVSFESGSYDNGDLVRMLVNSGGNPREKDMKGEMPKDLALMAGASRIYTVLRDSDEFKEKPTLKEFTVVDGLLSDGSKVDFASDAEAVLKELDSSGTRETINHTPMVDSNCELRAPGEVYQDDIKGVTYSVTLTKVDVAVGKWGMYNFYKLQIVRQKAKDMYVLFTRWGRIGDHGEWQHTAFPTAEDAIKEFCKVFKQKTGNEFYHLDRFVEQKKKYRLLPTYDKPERKQEVQFNFSSPVPSKLNEPVLDLLQEITNISMLQASAASKGVDKSVMPFGRIMRHTLDKATKVLLELEQLITTVDLQRQNVTTDQNEYQTNWEKMASLTSEFYHLVPIGGYEFEAIRPIRDKKVLKEHFRLVADLLDMEVASQILLGSQHRLAEMNPYDYIYRSMGCKIQPLCENDTDTQFILTYINASGRNHRVNAVYKVSRPGEVETLNKLGLSNHRLLWHGTSMANIVSILSKGLLVSPPGAPKTGNLFGEGVYFADCFAKSRRYCYNSAGSCKVMLLCEVALGNSLEDLNHDEEDHHDEDVNSLKVLGKMAPDPDFDIVLAYGVALPLGQLKPMQYNGKDPLVEHNEYIIHNPNQICIRYAVMFDG